MTLDDLVTALNNSSADAREILSKIRQLLTENTDVYFNLADGTVISAPSLPKLRQQYWDNMNSVMSRTYYVDAVNGDDSNDGTSTAPFKTLTKAIQSIPNGGWGYIWIRSDLVFSNTENTAVSKDNTTVLIVSDLGVNAKFSFIDNRSKILKGNNNRLWFRYIDFDFTFTGLAVETTLFMWNTHAYQGDAGFTSGGGLGLYECNVTISTDTDYVITFTNTIPFVKVYSTNITYTNSTGNDYFRFTDAASCKVLRVQNSTLTINGAAANFEDNIIGIIKDTNGVPRNIITNLIL